MIFGFISFTITVNAQITLQPTKLPGIEENLKKATEVLDKKVQPDSAQKIFLYNAFKNFYIRDEERRKNNPNAKKLSLANIEAIQNLATERDESVYAMLNKTQLKNYKKAAKKLDSAYAGYLEDAGREGPPPPGGDGGPPPSGN